MRCCSRVIAILLFVACFCRGARAATLHASLPAALEAAAADKSHALLIVSALESRSGREIMSALNAETLKTLGDLKIAMLDAELHAEVKRQFEISFLPTFVLISHDGKVVSRHVGFAGMEELSHWLKEALGRTGRGEWEGVAAAPAAVEDALLKKAAAGDLTTAELKQLVARLSAPDPAERSRIAGFVAEQRERALLPLIEALGDSYLGARIAANDLIRKLVPGAPEVDPWIGPQESAEAREALRKWWTATGKIPERPAEVAPDPTLLNSVRASIAKLKSDEPVVRTTALSALVRFGNEALPSIRDALKKAERAGDQRSAGLLDEARWAILVPDAAERQGGGLRQVLARGGSAERQGAASRLGRVGEAGLPALGELVNDSDPLVVEAAVRSLSSIGGANSVSAMATLLNAANSNLRMTAAQALGKTRRKEAAPHLARAAADPNEVVACAALAAIEEVYSRENSVGTRSSAELPAEAVRAIKDSLNDARWRVRATGVEVAGKLELSEMRSEVRALVADKDPFVVKTSLETLKKFGGLPEAAELVTLMKRLPAVRGDVINLLVEQPSSEAVKAITELYHSLPVTEQAALIGNLRPKTRYEGTQISDVWKPLLQHALQSAEKPLRAAGAEALQSASPAVAMDLVGPLLADAQKEIRGPAVETVLKLLVLGEGLSAGSDQAMAQWSSYSGSTTRTNFVIAPERRAEWHTNLARFNAADLASALSLFLTGTNGAGVDAVASALGNADASAAQKLASSGAIVALVARLEVASANAVIEKLRTNPVLMAAAASGLKRAKPEVAELLLEPEAFKRTMEAASETESAAALPHLINARYGWSLLSPDAKAKVLVAQFLDSKNSSLRAVSLHALAQSGAAAQTNIAAFSEALTNKAEVVRTVAIQGIAKVVKDSSERAKLLEPALADSQAAVREMAALALMESEVVTAAGLQRRLETFPLKANQQSYSYTSGLGEEDRPLPDPLPKPAFLPALIERTQAATGQELGIFSLLLAQYGAFEGLEKMIAAHKASGPAKGRYGGPSELLVCIALSKDSKYIPFVRELLAEAKDDMYLRQLLKAVKGMSGREARELRLEINKQMRKTT